MAGTKEDLASIAERVCADFAHKARPSRTMMINGVPFESMDGADGSGRCSEFARECTEAAIGKGQHTSPLFGGTAAETERIMAAKGLRTHSPQRGDLCCMDCGVYGHIIVCLGNGRYAENTGGARGPGYNVGTISRDFAGRSLRFYAVLPAGEAETQVVKLVDNRTGEVAGIVRMVRNGNHIADQGKLYILKP